MWIILGIILFIVTFYVHRHTYKYSGYSKYNGKLPCKVYMIALGIIIFCIPYLNIVAFLVGALIYFVFLFSEDICFIPTGIVKKIKDVLTKQV